MLHARQVMLRKAACGSAADAVRARPRPVAAAPNSRGKSAPPPPPPPPPPLLLLPPELPPPPPLAPLAAKAGGDMALFLLERDAGAGAVARAPSFLGSSAMCIWQ